MYRNQLKQKDISPHVIASGFCFTLDDPDAFKDIGQAIIHFRLEQSLTQAALAEKAGTTQSAIARIERGNDGSLPGVDLLNRIAAVLGLRLTLKFEKVDEQ